MHKSNISNLILSRRLLDIVLKLTKLMLLEPAPTLRRVYLFLERNFLKRAKTLCGPVIVKINTGYKCNLHCPMCPTGKHKKVNCGDLTLENIQFIIKRIGGASRISLFGWGEPFLNRDIFKIISLLKYNGKRIFIDSNLNITDGKIINSILNSNIDELSVSLDGANQKSYSEYRKGGAFNVAFNNMKKISSQNNGSIKIKWQYLVCKKNEHDIGEAIIQANKHNIQIAFSDMGMYLDNFIQPSEQIEREWRTNEQIERNKFACAVGDVCKYMYNEPFIDPDGRVYPCCIAAQAPTYLLERDYQNVFGNLNQHSLYEIWNNRYYQYMRNLFAGREYDTTLIKPICLACRVYADSKRLHG